MDREEIIQMIKQYADDMQKVINNTDINGNENMQIYTLDDLKHIDKYIKVCERCGKLFIPKVANRTSQKYCDKYCRNQATRTQRYEIKLDKRQRPVDLLRKTIYERKYRARRDNIPLDTTGYDIILKKLQQLVRRRWEISQKEYDTEMSQLHREYDSLVMAQKGKKIDE